MAINNVRAVGDDRPWKDEVERELKSIMDSLKYGKISLRAVGAASSAGGGGTSGAGADAISAVLPATYDSITYTIGINQDAFDHLGVLNYTMFDTTPTGVPTAVGTLSWNTVDETLDLQAGNITYQLGQELAQNVKRFDNSGLTDGKVVYVKGSDGANILVDYAIATGDITSATTFGVMTASASGGAKAPATTFGLVRNIDTSALTEGATVWLSGSVAGGMTTTKPTAPTHAVQVGFCIRSHATEGVVFVAVQNGYELDELHDVQITSATDGDILQRNSSNLWVNKSLSAAGIATSANPTFTGTVTTPLTTAGYVTTTSGGVLSSVATIPNAGLTNSAITVNGTSISLGGSGTVTAAPSGSAGGDLTGTYPNPTIKNDVVLTNPKIGRDNSASEGGQINFARASDNASYWYVDSYGSTSTPNLRFIEDTTPRFELVSGGALSISGQTGSAGQVLTSNGVGSAPTWNTVSGTSSNSFTTINAPAGTDPVATSSTDTLNLANGTGVSITGDSSTKTVTFGLANTAVTAASYGSATQVGTFTVDAQGRLTAAGNTTIAPPLDNLSDVTITSASTGQTLAYDGSVWVNSNYPSYNFLLNGGFDIWQRGTSITSTSDYSADRWYVTRGGGTSTVSRSTTIPSDANVQYSLSFVGSTAASNPSITQRIESSDTSQFVGKTVTLSIWARSSVGTAGLSWATAYPTATDNWTSETADQSGTFAASMVVGTWTRYTATFTVSASATTGYAIKVYRVASGVATTTLYAGAQLELGSIMTPFKRNSPSMDSELSACQRFYERDFMPMGAGFADGTTTGRVVYSYRFKRVAPSLSFAGGADTVRIATVGTDPQIASTSMAQGTQTSESVTSITLTTTGLTSGQGLYMYQGAAASTKYIEIDAELR